MATYDNTNRGSMWKNIKKADTHPDLRGEIDIEGKIYSISGWKNISENPKAPVLKLVVSEPYVKGEAKAEAKPKTPPNVDFDNDLPF